MRPYPRLLFACLLLTSLLLAGCSSRGVHMPKHRKQRHCDCPTFALRTTETLLNETNYGF